MDEHPQAAPGIGPYGARALGEGCDGRLIEEIDDELPFVECEVRQECFSRCSYRRCVDHDIGFRPGLGSLFPGHHRYGREGKLLEVRGRFRTPGSNRDLLHAEVAEGFDDRPSGPPGPQDHGPGSVHVGSCVVEHEVAESIDVGVVSHEKVPHPCDRVDRADDTRVPERSSSSGMIVDL